MKTFMVKDATPKKFLITRWLEHSEIIDTTDSIVPMKVHTWLDKQTKEFNQSFPDRNYIVVKRMAGKQERYQYALANLPEDKYKAWILTVVEEI